MSDRLIRESCCTSETLNALSHFEERFWWHLLVNCDDYGRMDGRHAVLKSRLFPLMEGVTIASMGVALQKLASVGLVMLYEVEGRPYVQVVNWDKHQRVRAKRSKYPAPGDSGRQMPTDDDKCLYNPIQSESESKSESESNPAKGGVALDAFERFWAVYPRKLGRKEAYRAFEKAIAVTDLHSILSAVEKQKACPQWRREGGQYIPYPATWLNQGRWEDETEVQIHGITGSHSGAYEQFDNAI